MPSLKNNKLDEKRNRAFRALQHAAKNKIVLERQVFFIPGWATEKSSLWQKPFSPENTSMKQWAERIVANYAETVHFITFSKKESDDCRSFDCFGNMLYTKIKPFLKNDNEVFDMAGYSMGGLDICSSVIFGHIPQRSVGKIITLGVPFRGEKWSEIIENFNIFFWLLFGSWLLVRYLIYKFRGYTEANIFQLESMRPRGRYIKEMNTKEHRLRLLSEVEKLYVFYGTDDTFVETNARFQKSDLPEELLKEKFYEYTIEGARHYGTLGLSQDPRVIAKILEILSGKKILSENNFS